MKIVKRGVQRRVLGKIFKYLSDIELPFVNLISGPRIFLTFTAYVSQIQARCFCISLLN
jgi:hypothetical protein